MTVRSIPAEKLPVGAAFTRLLLCLAEPTDSDALAVAARRCQSTPQVQRALELRLKSGVGAITTGDGPLAATGISAEILALLRTRSIAIQLAERCRRVPFRTKIARELGLGVGAAWRGEGLPTPAAAGAFDNIELDFTTVDTITPATRELFRFGPDSERTLRDTAIGGLAAFLDGQVLDPSVSAATARPASLTHDAESVTSSGASASQILADLDTMLSKIGTPGGGLVWAMRPLTFARIAAKLATVGLIVSPDNLLSRPVLLGSGSPRQVTLVDADAIVTAQDENIEVDVTRLAAIEMSDGPTQDGTTGGGASMVSLWQTDMLAIRAALPIHWRHVRFNDASPSQPSGAVYMPVDY
jgi:hypothetical protein